jgi:hypothetical protein
MTANINDEKSYDEDGDNQVSGRQHEWDITPHVRPYVPVRGCPWAQRRLSCPSEVDSYSPILGVRGSCNHFGRAPSFTVDN